LVVLWVLGKFLWSKLEFLKLLHFNFRKSKNLMPNFRYVMVGNQTAMGRRLYSVCCTMVELAGLPNDVSLFVYNCNTVCSVDNLIFEFKFLD
jgi:hypothetical protein